MLHTTRSTRGFSTFCLTGFVSFVKSVQFLTKEDVVLIRIKGIAPTSFISFISKDYVKFMKMPDLDEELRHVDMVYWRQHWLFRLSDDEEDAVVLRMKSAKSTPTRQLFYDHGTGFSSEIEDFAATPERVTSRFAITLTENSFPYKPEVFLAFLVLKENKLLNTAIELRGAKLSDLPPYEAVNAIVMEENDSIVLL